MHSLLNLGEPNPEAHHASHLTCAAFPSASKLRVERLSPTAKSEPILALSLEYSASNPIGPILATFQISTSALRGRPVPCKAPHQLFPPRRSSPPLCRLPYERQSSISSEKMRTNRFRKYYAVPCSGWANNPHLMPNTPCYRSSALLKPERRGGPRRVH